MSTYESEPSYLAVTDGLHAGVEPTGREIIEYIAAGDTIPGICLIRHMHPEAVRNGLRYLDSKELGAHFTEWVRTAPTAELDRDQMAARMFMDAPLPHFWLGIDPHDSPAPNANALVLGDRVTMTQIGVAGAMGLDNVVIIPEYPFLNHNRNFVLVETERAPQTNPLSQPGFWRECLVKMAELGPEGMTQLGQEIFADLNYYVKAELLRVDDHGNPDPTAIKRISRLEGVAPIGPYFTPIDPAHPVFTEFPYLRKYQNGLYAGNWDDNNHSPERPDDIGIRAVDDRPRRLSFGSLLLKVAASDFVENSNPG